MSAEVIDFLDAALARMGVAALSIRTDAARLIPGWVDDGSPRITALDWRGQVILLRAEKMAQLECRHPLR